MNRRNSYILIAALSSVFSLLLTVSAVSLAGSLGQGIETAAINPAALARG